MFDRGVRGKAYAGTAKRDRLTVHYSMTLTENDYTAIPAKVIDIILTSEMNAKNPGLIGTASSTLKPFPGLRLPPGRYPSRRHIPRRVLL